MKKTNCTISPLYLKAKAVKVVTKCFPVNIQSLSLLHGTVLRLCLHHVLEIKALTPNVYNHVL